MKKALITIFALAGLSGCVYYDYYKGGVRYTQDGNDCVYYAGEYGRNYSNRISALDHNKKIVYRNTRCEDLYARDNFGMLPRPERKVLVSAQKSCVACLSAGDKYEIQPVSNRKYVIVPSEM